MTKIDFMSIYRFIILTCVALMVINPLCSKDYHVSVNGNDGGNGSSSSPWRTLRHACSRVPANQGHRIVMSAGTFVEAGRCNLPSGVSLIGAGKNQTTITANSSFYRSVYSGYDQNLYLININGSNQRISGLTLDGKDKNVYGGIFVRSSNNIDLDNLSIKGFFFNGMWLWESRNVEFHDSDVFDCSWSSSGWAGGGIHLYKLTDVKLYNLILKEVAQRGGSKGGGNAIKAIGSDDNAMVRVILDNVDVDVNDYGTWQNGRAPNISIEFWNTSAVDCEIRNSYVRHHISIVTTAPYQNAPLPKERFRWRLLNNSIICRNSYPLEISSNNVEMAYNFINANGYGYMVANWERRKVRYQNWFFHNNVITNVGGFGWPNSLVMSNGGVKNLHFYNNTIDLKGTPIGVISVYGANSSEDIYIERNVFMRSGKQNAKTEPSRDLLIYARTNDGVHSVRNVFIRNNIFKDFPQDISSNVSNINKSGNQVGNPNFQMSGGRPFPYYQPSNSGLAASLKAGARKANGLPPIPIIPDNNPVQPTNPVTPVEPVAPAEPKQLSLPIRVNAGGGEFTAPNGDKFLADVNYYGTSKTGSFPLNIRETNKGAIYQTERWGSNFSYRFKVPNGTYDIALHFAEIYWEEAGKRVFDVSVEGKELIGDMDIYKEVGKSEAIEQILSGVNVTDGELNIEFRSTADNAKLSALEILGESANTPPTFKLSEKELFLVKNFPGSYAVLVDPDPVPLSERDEEVRYRVTPTVSTIANVEINEITGMVSISAKADQVGTQNFVVIADDGQDKNNIATQEFTLNIKQDGNREIPIGDEGITVRINAGGEAYTTEAGVEFEADNPKWHGGKSRSYSKSGEIDATNDDELYLSERWGGEFTYNILVPNGKYDVTLHFAEIYWKGGDYRVFDVDIEGEEVELSNLDIYSEVGYYNALVEKFEGVEIKDGEINLDFRAIKDNAKLSAVEIVSNAAEEDPEEDDEADFALRINSGSSEDMKVGDYTFIKDTFFTANSNVWYNTMISDVAGTEYDKLYLSERVSEQNMGTFNYNIPLENGDYVVFLHFAEIYFGAQGGLPNAAEEDMRRMWGKIEDKSVFKGLDLIKMVGSSTAYVEELQVSITDGELNIELGADKDRPKLAAIEIFNPEDADRSISNSQSSIAYRINCGSDVPVMVDGVEFMADAFYSNSSKKWRNSRISDIASTSYDELYLTERYADRQGGTFTYDIPVDNGEYMVTLHFAEIYFGAEGGSPNAGEGHRSINVTAEDQQIITDLDLVEKVGSATAYMKQVPVVVTDGILNLSFAASKDRPKISAIEVLSPEMSEAISYDDGRSSVRINSGATRDMMFNGYEFIADAYYTKSSRRWSNDDINEVKGTSFDQLYHTERTADKDRGDFSYEIPVENGDYVVYLHFAEIYFGVQGGLEDAEAQTRVFDVAVEGNEVLDQVNLVQLVGPGKVFIKEVRTTVKDGMLNIDLSGSQDRPKISAIEILIPSEAETSISKAANSNRLLEEANSDIGLPESSISIAPNPAFGETRLIVDSENWEGNFEVVIYDAMGRRIRSFLFSKERTMGKYSLDLDKMLPGLYVVSIVTGQEEFSKKLWISN